MNLFLEACGAPGPWSITVEGAGAPAPREPLSFDSPFVVIGQDAEADLCLPHKDVSERHAVLQWLGGRLRVLDLGSRTGVLYEGRRERAGWLEPGQTVRVGPYRIGLPNAPVAAGPETGVLAALVLDVKLRGIRAVTSHAAGALAVVGSAANCDVRLLDPAVSNYHCAIVNTPRGSWVVDLLGKGGITVNGNGVRSASLAEGDELIVGRSIIRVARIEWPAAGAGQTDADSPSEPAGAPNTQSWGGLTPTYPASVRDEPEPPFTAETTPQTERISEPRRTGFFSPWRRTPLPNRPSLTPTAAIETRDDSELEVEPSWSWTASARGGAEVLESAAPLPQWDEANRSAPGSAAASEDDSAILSGPERRTSCRYPVSGRTAQLHWWENGQPGDGGTGRTATSANGLGIRGFAAGQSGVGDLVGGDSAHNQAIAVTLVDISHAGLAVLSPAVPPAGEPLWFRLDDEPALDWVELSNVGSAPAGNGQHLVRCAFRESCPYDLFKTLVFSGIPARV